MSQIKTQQPIQHIPSFTSYGLQRAYFVQELSKLGIKTFPQDVDFVLDQWLYYTDLESWGKILYNMVFNSNLYKIDKFDCEDYALKAQCVSAERFDLNALRMCIGDMPQGKHGFNILFYGDKMGIEGVMLWEPNAGFPHSGEAFEIGKYGYKPEVVLI